VTGMKGCRTWMRCSLRMQGPPIQIIFRSAAILWLNPKWVIILAKGRFTFRGGPLPQMPQKLLSRFDPFLHTLQLCLLFQALQDQHDAVQTFLGVNAVTN
jgi:hypothetical protein